MSALAAIAAPLLARARADQVALLYRSWHRTTASMILGALILCTVLWEHASLTAMLAWIGAILVNQAWRGVLARAYRHARPPVAAAPAWGTRWSVGSTIAGGLWGVAAVAMFPASPSHQGLVIVCLFGVIMGGLNLTAVYKPSFYGFVLPAIVPLIVRVAIEGDQVHLFTAIVMSVVLAFVLGFGHHLNDVLTHAFAIRYENLDLIGELKAQKEAAEAARSTAEAADRAKSQFLAAASHDLRQPLHAMGLFAAALAAKARDADAKPLVASIQASIDALEGLFAQLLDLSRLDAGALRPQPGVVPLGPLLARLGADFGAQCAAGGIALRVVPTRIAVESDPVLLERILRNLLANAVRYTRSGGIVLGTRRQQNNVRIDVVDTGVGIAATDQARVFDEFVQIGAKARPAGGRGLGLGLAIVRRLAELLGHRVELASRAGRGSRFSIVLPRAEAQRRRADTGVQPTGSASGGSDATGAMAGRHVVVIDDDPAVVDGMRALFGAWNARVTSGADAAAAMRALTAAGVPPVDLIVADLRLADDACGLAAVALLRGLLGAAVPALIVSGDASEAARSQVRATGMTLLAKPLLAPVLLVAASAAVADSVQSAARR